MESKTRNKMRDCDANTKDQIKKVKEAYLKEAYEILTKTHKEILDKMEAFLSSSDHSETLSRWKNDTEKRVKEFYKENEKQAEKCCEDLEINKVNSIKADELVKQNFTKLDEKIKDLVDSSWSEDKQLTEADLTSKFEVVWNNWIEMFKEELKLVKVATYPTDYEIETEIRKILSDLLPADEKLIIKN